MRETVLVNFVPGAFVASLPADSIGARNAAMAILGSTPEIVIPFLG
jgi:hypothetical protein